MSKRQEFIQNNTAVVYARFSSHNQREESIDAQVRASKEYAERRGLQIVHVYADSAKSGTTSEREEFQKMVADSAKKTFRYVIIHKLDRFSRDKYDAVTYKHKLKVNGVSVLSVTENLDDSPESLMLESCLEGMAAYYSRNLAREVMKGMRESALKCIHLGGCAPLGYDVDPQTRKYVVNETEAAVIRLIFQQYVNGVGYNQILDYLNGMGIRTKRDQAFGKNSLYSILKNEKYVGKYTFNRKLDKDISGKRSPTLKPKEEWIIVPDGMPAIIDQVTFDMAQAKMVYNKKISGSFKAKEIYLLSGLIHCGDCGSSMYGNTRMCGRNKSNYSSYRCSSRAQHQGCKNKEIRRDYIDNYVLDELYRKLFTNMSIKKLAAMLNDYNQKKSWESNTELVQAKTELAEIERKISSIVRLVSESGISIETVKEDLRRLEERKLFIESYMEEMDLKRKNSLISEEVILELIYKSRDFIRSRNFAECRNFIRSYIENVVVHGDRVEVFFKIQVPDAVTDNAVPLTSGESKEAIREEYKSVPKGWNSAAEVPEQAATV
jgi:site-specific DNA recombinase